MKKLTVALIAVFLFPASFALGGEHPALANERPSLVNDDLAFAFHDDVPLQAEFMSDAEMVETQGEVLPLGFVILAHVLARVAVRHVVRNKAVYIKDTALVLGSLAISEFRGITQKDIDDAIKEHNRKSKAERERIEREFAAEAARRELELAILQAQEAEAIRSQTYVPFRIGYVPTRTINNSPGMFYRPPPPRREPDFSCSRSGGMDNCTITINIRGR